ncbi:hypothetical protein HPP92_019218 [Vanilla planifolia]|uniref:FAF domain-containing protein n=1 Tax=Vanilla planifolia TaxID=51239 RepID=A0A835QAA6_VANPL|nr:hypothetical protein HPP92_019218 [Vanilla planifolia]
MVAVCRTPAAIGAHEFGGGDWMNMEATDEKVFKLDIWSAIQKEKDSRAGSAVPFVHPLVRRSLAQLSPRSLEVCTESLGSETGSDEFSSSDELDDHFFPFSLQQNASYTKAESEEVAEEEEEENEAESVEMQGRKELIKVNYHCSISRRSPPRSFPPPLPSICHPGGCCIKLRPHRSDGRLVIGAITVPSFNYLHSKRCHGRLVLSFIKPTITPNFEEVEYQTNDEAELTAEEEADSEEEEVQVLDRGAMVELKVNTQPQLVNRVKVHLSSLVINKFVVGTPLKATEQTAPRATIRHPSRGTGHAADNFNLNKVHQYHLCQPPAVEAKMTLTSKRRSREEMLHEMRRCSELWQLLFIFEQPCFIATS